MSTKVAAVTGANKGIGYSIVKELCKRGVGVVYLCSRDVKRGQDAVEALKKEGLHPVFHQLDVIDGKSVKTFGDHIKRQHGGLDILFNNAGVSNETLEDPKYDDAKRVIDVNYRSIVTVQEILFPLLKKNARVINISSNYGHLTSNIANKYWIERLSKEDITMADIDGFVNWFLDSVKNGTLKSEDFVTNKVLPYKVSKVAVCALTRYQQRIIDRNISINSVHPGFVRTDMTYSCGNFDPEEAGITPVYLALDIDQAVKGKYFWYDKTEVDWTKPEEKVVLECDNVTEVFVKLAQSYES